MDLKKFVQIISFILCFSIINGTVAIASTDTTDFSQSNLSLQSISSDSVSTQSKTVGKNYYIMLPIVFIHNEPTLFSSFGIVLWSQKVTVLSNTKFYSFVETENEKKGYIFSGLLGEKPFKNKSLTIPSYAHAYVGRTSPTKISADYNGDGEISWTVSDNTILSFDQETGIITGLKPGVATITAKAGLFNSDECIVSVINQWKENETTSVQNQVTLRSAPGDNYDARITVKKGTSVTAKGDFANSNGWIYVSTTNNSYYGFIKLSDFSGIDYLTTQYHYYDEGYNIRFGSASTKIYDYASALNDVMMANFKLKVCPYVEAYTSAADNCKIMSYNSVEGNLAKACPKTAGHGVGDENSCLTTKSLRNQLITDKEAGSNFVTKAVWTGHIMDGHKTSTSEFNSRSLVFTTANTVKYNSTTGSYTNKNSSQIRYYTLYELIHETGHQFGLIDGYCYRDNGNSHCTNNNCYKCNGKTIPDCIMSKIKSPDDDKTPFCDNCRIIIENHLNSITERGES